MFVTIEIADLDRLTHALLIAKADYLCDAIKRQKTGHDWTNANANIDALNALYTQLIAAQQLVDA